MWQKPILQKKELALLIEYYKTGDLKKWDEYNVAWAKNSDQMIDYINGFIENYEDPMEMKATWESIVNYTDIEATKRTKIITANAQWFEDNSPMTSVQKRKSNRCCCKSYKYCNAWWRLLPGLTSWHKPSECRLDKERGRLEICYTCKHYKCI